MKLPVYRESYFGYFSGTITRKYSENAKVFTKFSPGKTGLKENHLLLFPS
jgi:hypothetical protein